MTATPMAPVSWGELIDKITILEIKAERLTDAAKRDSVVTELTLLSEIAAAAQQKPDVAALTAQLKAVNKALWEIEDHIRDKEAAQEFDARFIELARAVYVTNDRRAALKRDLNRVLGSGLVEETSYKPYTAGAK